MVGVAPASRSAPPAEVRELGAAGRAVARRCEDRAEGHRRGCGHRLQGVSAHGSAAGENAPRIAKPRRGNTLAGLRPWLLAVTANEARQLLRRRHGPVVEIDVDVAADRRADPSAGIERLDLRRALAHLSPDDRALVAMHYVIDLSSDELGAAIGTSPSAARMRLSRIVDRLRKELCDG